MLQMILAATLAITFYPFSPPSYAFDVPWSTRVDAAPGSAKAQPEMLRWCLPATESALPLVNAYSAQAMVLDVHKALDNAFVVEPTRAMNDSNWATFLGNTRLAQTMALNYSVVLAKQPAQTLKQFTDQCGTGADPTLQAKLDKALADLAAARAAQATEKARADAAVADLVAVTKDRDGLKTLLQRVKELMSALTTL